MAIAAEDIQSPVVASDRRVTFRLHAPNAASVFVEGGWSETQEPLAKNRDGVWSITVGPLEPDIYNYRFVVDGLIIGDPLNSYTKYMFFRE